MIYFHFSVLEANSCGCSLHISHNIKVKYGVSASPDFLSCCRALTEEEFFVKFAEYAHRCDFFFFFFLDIFL